MKANPAPRRALLAAALFGLALLGTAPPAWATDEMRSATAELADKLKQFLDGKGEKALVVKAFEEKGTLGAPPSGLIKQLLLEELKKRGIEGAVRGKFGVRGQFTLVDGPPGNPDLKASGVKFVAVELNAVLFDSTGNEIDIDVRQKHFQKVVPGQATVIALFGPTVVQARATGDSPLQTMKDNDLRIRKAIIETEKPTAEIDGTVVRSIRKGKWPNPYAIEILVGGRFGVEKDGKAPTVLGAEGRKAELKSGLAFVDPPLRRDEEYAVRIINDSAEDVAVQLRIDGISMFAFSALRQPDRITVKGKEIDNPRRGEPRYSLLIVPAKSRFAIPGWHVDNAKSDRFLITEYAKSAAAQFPKTGDQGMISATFQEVKKIQRSVDGSGDLTGRGKRVDQKYTEAQVNLGEIVDVITVRYTIPPK